MKKIINNININYNVNGNNEKVILLLHGWGSNIKLFDTMISGLIGHHKVYALDLPGFGGTGEPPFPWNVDNYADFVIEFIKEMKIKKISLLGHSFGGRVIIKIVNKPSLPFELEKLVLVDSAGILPKKSIIGRIKTFFIPLIKRILSTKIMMKLFPNIIERLKNKFGSTDYKSATPVMRKTLVKVVNEDLEPLLSSIKQPTLLIWGDKDTDTPITDAEIMKGLIPDAGLISIKGAGHYSFLEQPVIVNNVLDSFLNSKE